MSKSISSEEREADLKKEGAKLEEKYEPQVGSTRNRRWWAVHRWYEHAGCRVESTCTRVRQIIFAVAMMEGPVLSCRSLTESISIFELAWVLVSLAWCYYLKVGTVGSTTKIKILVATVAYTEDTRHAKTLPKRLNPSDFSI